MRFAWKTRDYPAYGGQPNLLKHVERLVLVAHQFGDEIQQRVFELVDQLLERRRFSELAAQGQPFVAYTSRCSFRVHQDLVERTDPAVQIRLVFFAIILGAGAAPLASSSSGISSSRAIRAAIERLGSRWSCSR